MNPALVLLVVIAVILYLAFQLFVSARRAMKNTGSSNPEVPDTPTTPATQKTGPPAPADGAGGFKNYLQSGLKSLFPGLVGSKKQRVPATPKPDNTPIAGEESATANQTADQIGNYFQQSWQGLSWN